MHITRSARSTCWADRELICFQWYTGEVRRVTGYYRKAQVGLRKNRILIQQGGGNRRHFDRLGVNGQVVVEVAIARFWATAQY